MYESAFGGGIATKAEKKVFYYENELTDEFSSAQITAKKIDAGFSYNQDKAGRKIGHMIWYRMLARPLAYVYLKLWYGHRIEGKETLQKAKKQGYFLYGNHTNAVADALIPSMLSYPKDAYVIVHPNNVSMPLLGRITPCLGALPLPDDMDAAKNFVKEIKKTIERGKCVMIYPEAHIWPYYTKIRPFTDASFRYPVQCDAAVYCFTNTYQKRKYRKTPRMVTYVDGPFYPEKGKTAKEQKHALRECVFQSMVNRSKKNTVEKYQYIRMEQKND